MIIYGVGLLAFAVLMPEGLAGGLGKLAQRLPEPWRPSPPRTRALRADGPMASATNETVAAAALTIDGVVKRFGGVTALDGVSLEAPAGRILAVVGPNGSGKTTLLNVVSGFYGADGGSILLAGQSLGGKGATAVARLGIGRTFQTPKLMKGLTVLENVRFGGYARERASGVALALHLPSARRESHLLDAEAFRLLTLVGIAHRANDLADELPHGQQRLVEIARALLGRPRVLMLDEPAAGLSMNELSRLADIMREIRRLGVTLIMVEHHIELVSDVADAVVVLDQGRVLAQGTAQDVFATAAVMTAYTGGRK